MSGWQYAKALADKHDAESDGLFVRLTDDGDKVVGVFVGEPYAREVHWSGERYVSCLGDGCSFCEAGKKPSLRVAINFYVPGQRSLKVIEGGIVWFKDLVKVREKYGLNKWSFEIERHGEAGNPKTTYTILPEEKLTDEVTAEINKLELHDLAKVTSGDTSGDTGSTSENDKRIAPQITTRYIERLKALPREAVDEFLSRFEVERIRDLKMADKSAAESSLEQLEKRYRESPQAAERDPFA